MVVVFPRAPSQRALLAFVSGSSLNRKRDIHDCRRCDHLARNAAPGHKAGPQRFVPTNDLVERGSQRSDVQRPAQPQHGRDIIEKVARLELVEEPETLLRE